MNNPGRQLASFLLVGGLSTILHFSVLFIGTGLLGMPVVWCSVAGYVAGGALNYLLNRRHTFRSELAHRTTASRFMAVAVAGLLANGFLMQLFAIRLGMHYLFSQAITTGIVLAWNFLASRHWAFAVNNRPKNTQD